MTDEQITTFAEALRAVERADGRTLSPEDVVRVASDPNHVLHGFFDWDDTSAAHKYRVEQARHLIYRVRVTITDRGSMVPVSIRGYVRDPDRSDTEQGMVSLEHVLDNTARSRKVLDRELERLSSWIERVHGLSVAMHAEDEFYKFMRGWATRVRPKVPA